VAAILRDGPGGAEVLMIQRAERAGDPWSGHMALPGGRRDPADPDLHATAVRETREEVGIDLDADGALLGRLADREAMVRSRRAGRDAPRPPGSRPPTPSLMITPFVFALTREVPLVFDPGEVAEALWASLAAFARGEGAGILPYTHEGQLVELPCWTVQGRVVWGLTYGMLRTLLEVLGG
jgi:8-oxo-dGTP pyrophosphatase MutT (NUDIX family)